MKHAPQQDARRAHVVALALLAALASSCTAASPQPDAVAAREARGTTPSRADEPQAEAARVGVKPPASGASVGDSAAEPQRPGPAAAAVQVAKLRDVEVSAVAGPDGRITVTKNGAATATLETHGAERFATRTHFGRLFVFASMPPMKRANGTLTWAQWRVVEVLADGTARSLPDLEPSPPEPCKWATDIHAIGDPATDVRFGFDVHCTGEGWRADLEIRTWWNPDKRAYVHSPIKVIPRGGG